MERRVPCEQQLNMGQAVLSEMVIHYAVEVFIDTFKTVCM